MKMYKCVTRFGTVINISTHCSNLINSSPVMIYNKIRGKRFPTVFDFIGNSTYSNGPVMKRFLSRVMIMYAEEAISAMINERMEVPITDNGTFMAVGLDMYAPTKKDYVFDFETQGKKFAPLFVMTDPVSKLIGYIYRIRLHPNRQRDLENKVREKFFYPTYQPTFMMKNVNGVFEQFYLKKYKNPKYGYSIKF